MELWTMIINPASASASRADLWKACEKILTDGGLQVRHLLTEYPGQGIELARQAAAEGCRKLVAVGGDGTIHEVMTGLLRYCDAEKADMGDFTLAVIPYGTGNDWIRTSLVPRDLSEATRCILAGKTAREDVVRLTFGNGTFCMANIGGIGLDADICYNTNKLKEKGHKGGILYKLVAPWSIFSKKCRPVEIVCDGKPVYKGKLYSAVIGNGIYRGGGIHQNADGGSWSDGQLELSVMPGVNAFKGLSQMLHAIKGDFAVQPGIITLQFKKMTVTPLGGRPDRVESDGEIPGSIPLTVEVTGQQINIIVP